MGGDTGVRGVGVDDGGLEQGADSFEVEVAGAEEERFSGVEEGEAQGPGGGEGVEFIYYGEEELHCYRGFLGV